MPNPSTSASIDALHLENINDAVFIISSEGTIIRINAKALDMLGYEEEEIKIEDVISISDPEVSKRSYEMFLRCLSGTPSQFELQLKRKDGQFLPTEISTRLIPDSDPKIILAIVRDISKHVNLELSLRKKISSQQIEIENLKSRYQTIIEDLPDGIIITDAEGLVVLWNKGAEKIFGYDASETLGQHIDQLIDTPSRKRVFSELLDYLLQHNGRHSEDYVARRDKSGRVVYTSPSYVLLTDKDGNPTGLSSLERDVTQRKKLEEELRRMAITDPLTSAYNRHYFNTTILKEIESVAGQSRPYIFLMMDINRFKEINDTQGHLYGDEVLKEVAGCIRNVLRGEDPLIRFGGDEFLAVLKSRKPEDALPVITRIQDSINDWCSRQAGLPFPVTLSYGYALCGSGSEIIKALTEADIQLYKSKEEQQNK